MGAEAIIGNIVAGGGGELLHGLSEVIDSVKGHSPETAAKLETLRADYVQAQIDLQKVAINADMQASQMQSDVNKAEASNVANWFVSSWRPLIGYICGAGLASQFIVSPLATWVAALYGHPIVYPSLDLGTLMTLLFGMLGLGGMRTLEKVQGVAAPGVK